MNLVTQPRWKKIALPLLGFLCVSFFLFNFWETVGEGRLRSIGAALGTTIVFATVSLPLFRGNDSPLEGRLRVFVVIGIVVSIASMLFIPGSIRI